MEKEQIAENVIATVASIDDNVTFYDISCSRCGHRTRVAGIVEVLVTHTTALGRFRSSCCAGAEASARRVGDDPEGEFFGAFMIDSGIATDFPFGFVLTPANEGTGGGLCFDFAVDNRPAVIERLRKGDASGGPLTIASAHPRTIIKHLREVGLLPAKSKA